MNKRNEKGEHHKRIYGILEYIFLLKGSQRVNKKKENIMKE
jgi:hypothetical protein